MDNEARAHLAATALVEAAGTAGWDAAQPEILRWFGQGRAGRKAARQLGSTRRWMLMAVARAAAGDAQGAREAAHARAAQAREWEQRFAAVLARRPGAAAELDLLVEAIQGRPAAS